MDRGTYVSAALGLADFRKLEIVNNNLANVNTPGFKRQYLVGASQTFDSTLAKAFADQDPYAKGDHERTPGIVSLESKTDFSAGPVKNTGNVFDVALENPKDFFAINTPDGVHYTRAGNFTLNVEGEMVTSEGYQVLGDGGAITVNGPNVAVAPSGVITVGGTNVGRLQVVRFEDPSKLERVAGTRFKLIGNATPPAQVEAAVIPKALEMSNVSAISSMIDLIAANRGFEMYVRTAQTTDQMNQTAIGQVGRAR